VRVGDEVRVAHRDDLSGDRAARPFDEQGWLSRPVGVWPAGIASEFVQLAYPWPRTPGSAGLPERLEPPDGVLAGLLARNALSRGAFHSAAGLATSQVFDAFPILGNEDLSKGDGEPRGTFPERVSIFGPTFNGWRLLSDVTTALDLSARPASVRRLVAVIVRAARRLGEELLFEPSSEALWGRIEDRLSGLMSDLFALGALRGNTAADAFRVRCDRGTMTRNDLDAGRVVAAIQFDPAVPIERIQVVLALTEGGVDVRSIDVVQKGAA